MRIAELLGLRDRDIDFSAKSIKVTGKRDKQRIIPFGEELERAMTTYMGLRDQSFEVHDDSFFVGNKGKAVSRSKVERVVKSYLTEVTSIKKKSPHVLRHTFATLMLNHKADLVAIQNLLGHASLRNTEVYTHTSFEELKSVYKDAHPRE
jgi:integrase/recombinase XerC